MCFVNAMKNLHFNEKVTHANLTIAFFERETKKKVAHEIFSSSTHIFVVMCDGYVVLLCARI